MRPNLVAPPGGSFTRTPTVEWEAIPFASAYELYSSSSSGVERIEDIEGTTYTPTEAVPNFAWSSVPGAGRYALFVQNLDTLEVVINDANLLDTIYTPETDLPSSVWRFWVKAIDVETDDFNSGLWSNPLSFSITSQGSNDTPSTRPLASIEFDIDAISRDAHVDSVDASDHIATNTETAGPASQWTAKAESKPALCVSSPAVGNSGYDAERECWQATDRYFDVRIDRLAAVVGVCGFSLGQV